MLRVRAYGALMRPARDRGANLPSHGVLAFGMVLCVVLVLVLG